MVTLLFSPYSFQMKSFLQIKLRTNVSFSKHFLPWKSCQSRQCPMLAATRQPWATFTCTVRVRTHERFCNTQAYFKRLPLDELKDMHGIYIFLFAVSCADLPPLTSKPAPYLDLRLFHGYIVLCPHTAFTGNLKILIWKFLHQKTN